MKNRIDELIVASGLYESSEEDLYRFVETIIKECIGVIEESEGYSRYFPHVVENIEKHFNMNGE